LFPLFAVTSASKDLGKETVVFETVFEALNQQSQSTYRETVGFLCLHGKMQPCTK